MTVYVVQEMRHLNYTPAEKFGEVVFMTNTEFRLQPGSQQNELTLSKIQSDLAKFQPERDFIVLTGGPVLCGIVLHMILRDYGVANVLHWDGMARSYIPYRIDLESLKINPALRVTYGSRPNVLPNL